MPCGRRWTSPDKTVHLPFARRSPFCPPNRTGGVQEACRRRAGGVQEKHAKTRSVFRVWIRDCLNELTAGYSRPVGIAVCLTNSVAPIS